MTIEEIAELQGISISSIRRQLSAARLPIQKKWIYRGKNRFKVYHRQDVMKALAKYALTGLESHKLKDYISADIACKLYGISHASLLYRLRSVPLKVDVRYLLRGYIKGSNLRKYYNTKQLDEAMMLFLMRENKKRSKYEFPLLKSIKLQKEWQDMGYDRKELYD